jgi:single-strand DNA-binding protein
VHEPHLTLAGNVAAVPTLRLAGGVPVTSFRIGVTPRKRDKGAESWSDGETLWFSVTAWRALAEHCVTSLAKGDRVLVEGRLTQRTWTTDDGVERSSLEIDAVSVGLDLSRSSALSARRAAPSQRSPEDDEAGAGQLDDDLPEPVEGQDEPVGQGAAA